MLLMITGTLFVIVQPLILVIRQSRQFCWFNDSLAQRRPVVPSVVSEHHVASKSEDRTVGRSPVAANIHAATSKHMYGHSI